MFHLFFDNNLITTLDFCPMPKNATGSPYKPRPPQMTKHYTRPVKTPLERNKKKHDTPTQNNGKSARVRAWQDFCPKTKEIKKMLHEIETRTPAIERLFQAVQAERATGKETRRWSYEIEANYLGAGWHELDRLGVFDGKSDSSVNYRWDGCTCDSCEHDCNCNDCSRTNGWDDSEPCDESQFTEIAPNKYSRCTTADHEGNLILACSILDSVGATVDNSTGGHIHIDAREMTTRQVSNLMKVWHTIQTYLPEVVGRTYREAEGFADQVTDYDLKAIERDEQTGRGAVNPNNWLNHKMNTAYKNTIEFRQFSGTLDSDLIMMRGILCRKLVEYCERQFSVYYLLNADSPEKILTELGL